LLACGVGITNLVARATAAADELTPDEIRAGRPRLERKVRRYRPRAVAVVGIGAYRIAFGRPRATFGRQPDDIAGALLWVLPNTSGLNAHYQAAGFARAFAELRRAVDTRRRGSDPPSRTHPVEPRRPS
jgi:TDG/mug DNA glycosylase family protein